MGESMEKAGKVSVVAVTKIPRGSRSENLQLDRSLLLQDVGCLVNTVQVGIWTNSEIQPLNMSQLPTFWPKLIKLAPDCHAQNVQLSRNGTEVMLQATKDIPSSTELLLWFDEDILMDEMHIPPYLSPVNIRGGNSYICNLCGASFEAPNNLKVHIALKCDTFPVSVLWGRLVSSPKSTPPIHISNSPSSSSSSPFWPSFHSSTSTDSPTPLVPILVNRNHTLLHHQHHLRMNFGSVPVLPYSNNASLNPPVVSSSSSSSLALDVPVLPSTHRISNGHNNHRVPVKINATKNKTTKSRVVNTNGHQQGVKQRCRNPSLDKAISVSVSDPEAQLESIVSNMGKARNGHMCLYCGKLYSRKYGLKIHIRTHTGYKPLRCKICHRPFGDPSNLNKHIRLHSDGNTPYRCDICHKVLVRKRDLERHIRSRHTNPVIPISIPERMALDCSRTSSSSQCIGDVDVLNLNTS